MKKLILEIGGMTDADIERLKGNIIGSVENTFKGTCEIVEDNKAVTRRAKKEDER